MTVDPEVMWDFDSHFCGLMDGVTGFTNPNPKE